MGAKSSNKVCLRLRELCHLSNVWSETHLVSHGVLALRLRESDLAGVVRVEDGDALCVFDDAALAVRPDFVGDGVADDLHVPREGAADLGVADHLEVVSEDFRWS